jgi:hypothetical protein
MSNIIKGNTLLFHEVIMSEDLIAFLSPEQVRDLKLKKNAIYMVKGLITKIEEIDEEYIKESFK